MCGEGGDGVCDVGGDVCGDDGDGGEGSDGVCGEGGDVCGDGVCGNGVSGEGGGDACAGRMVCVVRVVVRMEMHVLGGKSPLELVVQSQSSREETASNNLPHHPRIYYIQVIIRVYNTIKLTPCNKLVL